MIVFHRHHLRAAAVFAAAALIISCAGAPPVQELQPVRTPQGLAFHSGKRTDQEGIPVLDLCGSRYKVGLQYGVLLRPEIRYVYSEYDKMLDTLAGGRLRRFFFVRSFASQVQAMRKALPPGFEEELRGIADGSEIRFSDFLFFALTPEFFFDASCTSIVVKRGSEIAHGRNFDFMQPASFISRYPVIARVAVQGKIPYVNMGFIGLPGVYTGLNDRGIAISVNMAAFSAHASGPVIPIAFLVKSILESCTTLQEVDSITSRSLPVSHYFITVSSKGEQNAVLYEDLGDSVTKVPLSGNVLFVTNAPISAENQHKRTSVLAQGEYNLSREHELGVLTKRVSDGPLCDHLLGVLGNHDFYEYRDFPADQSPAQDSLKTINNYETLQSAVIDWTNNQVIFSYQSSYAAFGPFLTYDIPTGRLTRYRKEDPFASQPSFRCDTEFLDKAFALYLSKRMTMDRDGWQRLALLVKDSPGINPFLRDDWTFSSALALGHFQEAESAAREIGAMYPDYYLGPLDLGLAEYRQRHWIEAKGYFVDVLRRNLNAPESQLVALAYASLASREAGQHEQSVNFSDEARALLRSYWVPKDLDEIACRYVSEDDLVSFIRSLANERWKARRRN